MDLLCKPVELDNKRGLWMCCVSMDLLRIIILKMRTCTLPLPPWYLVRTVWTSCCQKLSCIVYSIQLVYPLCLYRTWYGGGHSHRSSEGWTATGGLRGAQSHQIRGEQNNRGYNRPQEVQRAQSSSPKRPDASGSPSRSISDPIHSYVCQKKLWLLSSKGRYLSKRRCTSRLYKRFIPLT